MARDSRSAIFFSSIRRSLSIGLIVTLLGVPAAVLADWDSANKALRTRDYAAALVLLTEMANEGKQILLTSHSDHVLLALRDLVLNGKISGEDVKVYHFEKVDRESKANEVEIMDDEAIKELFEPRAQT